MNASTRLEDVLSAVSTILLWCFVVGTLLLTLALGLFLAAGDLAYQVHSRVFDLSEHDFALIWYAWMGLIKIETVPTLLGIPAPRPENEALVPGKSHCRKSGL